MGANGKAKRSQSIIIVEYPNSLPDSLHVSNSEFESEARLAMAAKLFEMGRLTSGQAAALCGLTRIRFLADLGRFGVSSLQTETDGLAEDAANAPVAHDRR
jgi:predicted HTH domain antitoxin